jgi:hypothetical protein
MKGFPFSFLVWMRGAEILQRDIYGQYLMSIGDFMKEV